MSNENANKYLELLKNSTDGISSGVGGALLGSTLFGPIGAILGGVAGLVIGSSKLQEYIAEIRAQNEINDWKEFFYSLPSKEMSELKQAFLHITDDPSKSVALSKWNALIESINSDERKSLLLKRENYKTEKDLQKKREELDKINRQLLKEQNKLEEIKKNIQDLSPSAREEIIKDIQALQNRGEENEH